MNDIKKLKNQSLLKEAIQEALCSLKDNRLNTLAVNDVNCSNGKYFCKIFIDSTTLDENQRKKILKLLKNASGIIKQYLQNSLSWYRIPDFKFSFDTNLETINKLNNIFKQINERKNNE